MSHVKNINHDYFLATTLTVHGNMTPRFKLTALIYIVYFRFSIMASAMPKSLQRTDSTGQLNVFILLKKKSNDDLVIVSREDLPPTLRNGRLVLNQKIIIRDEERNSIEGVIVYMRMYSKTIFYH
jgi:hypothetical protein